KARIRFKCWLSGRRHILLWIDADIATVRRVANRVKKNFPFVRLKVLNAPSEILLYPMKRSVVEAVVFISTDVTKLSSDDEVREQIEEELKRYVLDGGGLVAGHDLIYRRTHSKYLCKALGEIRAHGWYSMDNTPVRYEKTAAGKLHPIGRRLPDNFSLDDGEVLSVEWLPEVEVIFQQAGEANPVRGLVAARQFEDGRIVWLNSCDHGVELSPSINLPSAEFIALLAASIEWVARAKQFATGAPLIGAHRGATGFGPENTMTAFHAAIALKADFIETDIRRTADGILVLHHDPEVGSLKICDTPFAALEAAALTLKRPLAKLEDLLELARGKINLDLELKEAGYESAIADMLRAHQIDTESFVITSFLESAVQRFKESYREARCGLLIGDRSWWKDFFPEIRIRRCGADFVAAKDSLVKLGFVRRLTAQKFPVWVWTVNDPFRIAKLLRMPGVEAVITDSLYIGQNEQARARND